ncbi:MAG TPA: hypothetical protein VHZ29_00520 [Rhizomicrobium sp.]|jgi:hypothetical protein|nr:hypothetical protein [Rhizomicrobium sp.]
MTILVSEYLHVADRAAELGVRLSDDVEIMPDNFASAASRDELVLHSETAHVRRLLREKDLGGASLDGRHAAHEDAPGGDWSVTLFAPCGAVRRDPERLIFALAAISDHLADVSKASPRRQVHLSVVVERGSDRSCKRLTCAGDVSSLRPLVDKALAIAGE